MTLWRELPEESSPAPSSLSHSALKKLFVEAAHGKPLRHSSSFFHLQHPPGVLAFKFHPSSLISLLPVGGGFAEYGLKSLAAGLPSAKTDAGLQEAAYPPTPLPADAQPGQTAKVWGRQGPPGGEPYSETSANHRASLWPTGPESLLARPIALWVGFAVLASTPVGPLCSPHESLPLLRCHRAFTKSKHWPRPKSRPASTLPPRGQRLKPSKKYWS